MTINPQIDTPEYRTAVEKDLKLLQCDLDSLLSYSRTPQERSRHLAFHVSQLSRNAETSGKPCNINPLAVGNLFCRIERLIETQTPSRMDTFPCMSADRKIHPL